MKTKGFAHTYGDNIDTDVIIPARYLNIPDPKELAVHCMEDIDAQFTKKVRNNDVIAAGWNLAAVHPVNTPRQLSKKVVYPV